MGNLLPFAQKFTPHPAMRLVREALIFSASRSSSARAAYAVLEALILCASRSRTAFLSFFLCARRSRTTRAAHLVSEPLARDLSRSSRPRGTGAAPEPFARRGSSDSLRSSLLLTKRGHYVYSSANRDAREADSLRFASGAPGGGPQGGFFDIRWTHEVRRARGGARRSWGSCGLAALAAGYSAALVCWITS